MKVERVKVTQALLSVSDKTGLVDFARGLAAAGVRLLSTGGTARALTDAGLGVTEVADYTGFPEMLDGRVKTLHPKVHAGILGRRDVDAHAQAMCAHDIPAIDLVVVNLYPFRETVAKPGCTLDDAIENIDIGGPAMVRSAAKNHAHVGIVVDPADYPSVLSDVRDGGLSAATRFRLAQKAFSHTAAYDAAIGNYLTSLDADGRRGEYPSQFNITAIKVADLRYGENPHQSAALYRDPQPAPGTLATCRQRQGKELSYNNIADADAAWECVKTLRSGPAFPMKHGCVIVKHANPCGVSLGTSARDAYERALATDPVSAFGGIIAFDCAVDASTAEAISSIFVEVVVAPSYSDDALALFARKANVRVLEVAVVDMVDMVDPSDAGNRGNPWDLKRIGGGLLVQTPDARIAGNDELKPVTKRKPDARELEDLKFAWRVARFVKSNAIVFCRDLRTLGVGAGQMSRVDSARIAAIKAKAANLDLGGSVVASDAFFPFRDGLDAVIDVGARAVIQPGGSLRDGEVIAAADERGVAMIFTGIRHFRH